MLHAFWSLDRGPGLWAEDSRKPVTSAQQGLKSARSHPFAASAETLTKLHVGEIGETTLLLPSLRRSPLDSPEIVRIAPRPASSSVPSLLPWSVPVLWVDPEVLAATNNVDDGADLAAALFPSPSQRDHAGPLVDVRVAASVRYLGELVRFAGELAERGRVLPGIVWVDGAGHEDDATIPGALTGNDDVVAEARWRAVLRGPDALAFSDLTAGMPPSFRAAPASEDAGALAALALDVLADAVVRGRLPEGMAMLPSRRGRTPRQVPAAEAWVEALRGVDARIRVPSPMLAALEEELAPWRSYARESNAPARATFRLSENPGNADALDLLATPRTGADEDADQPPELRAGSATEAAETQADSHPWRLEFLLQSAADPSLLVAAEQVWRDGDALARWLGHPKEVLLAELGRAARVYPGLEQGLRQTQPTGFELTSEQAFAFLQDGAPALDGAGFGVQLPAWWDKQAKLGLKLSAATPMDDDTGKPAAFGREQLCDFRWSIAVGEHSLSDEEIDALAQAKAPLVRLRGHWVSVNPEQLRAGIDFLRRRDLAHGTVADVLRLAGAHPGDAGLPLEIAEVTADGWLGALLDGSAEATIQTVAPPSSFTATLRPYQERGLAWLDFLGSLGLGACLADDMGLGKTIQLLALEALNRERAPDAGPTLLVCPMSLIGNWEAEAAKFAPALRLRVHHGSERLRGAEFDAGLAGVDLLVTTYTTLTRDLEEFEAVAWNRVVLDEAQAVKNRLSRAAKAVKRLTATHRIALTGTPVENRLGEMYSIMDFLNPGLLGTPELFRTRYAIPIERHRDTAAAERVRAMTRPYLLRRVKTDPSIIDDLPEKIEIKQYYTLTTEQASLYQSVVDDMMEKIEGSDGIARRGNVLAAMAKLKQICNHPAQLLHDGSEVGRRSGKVERLEEILEEILAEGDKVLCFTQYTEFAEMLMPHLAARFDTDVAYLHGGTSRQNRTELVRRFQSPEGPPIFLLSLKAGGTGLNLTAANHVIHLDRWWNPAVENQATDRAFRIGQKRRVQVRKFICRGTLEERIDAMIEEKASLANMVVGDGEGWLTELSTQNLRELFALSQEAVNE
ncbi:DEAD/DEAH box helicase [Arthrobacter sp. H35-D1]|uniref:DEAD/DEAH box helicase n=1 Tax=Arthrobacter sp. H35-D1 TaxID=3046202 RepID=UPI0024BA5520|nr:DEAD/DEAH box helicase [Arthrobacter sp. H35-D1]MDJ0315345.1 DEAD/DEAH box helicase [Arthrobacter sp. H35-D1]